MTTLVPPFTLSTRLFQNTATSVLLPLSLGMTVGFMTGRSQNVKRYKSLKQPPRSPPSWAFGPAWTVLYCLMGYAAHRITMVGLSPFASPSTILLARRSLTLYVAQLALNLIWTPIFFTARRPVEATIDITALLGLNAYLTYLWSSIDSVAAYCQIPYLGWLSYATYLCVGVSHLNGWDLRTPEEKKKDN